VGRIDRRQYAVLTGRQKMTLPRLLTVALVTAFSVALLASPAAAQNQRGAAQAKPQVQAKPRVPAQIAQIEQKCLRALNGACTSPIAVEAVRLRAEIIPAVPVSYFGTPAGTIGGPYIPYERFFQDNPLVFGLRTFVFVQPCCVTRSK
jgi:hypothetical protein